MFVSIFTIYLFLRRLLPGVPCRHFLEGGEERRVLTSEVFASQHASGMETPATGATVVADEKRWVGDQEKFPIRERLS